MIRGVYPGSITDPDFFSNPRILDPHTDVVHIRYIYVLKKKKKLLIWIFFVQDQKINF